MAFKIILKKYSYIIHILVLGSLLLCKTQFKCQSDIFKNNVYFKDLGKVRLNPMINI